MINLKKEASYLNYQLDFLRSKHKLMRADGAVAEWEEKAIAQRHKRRQAEELNMQLRYALFQQSGYLNNFKAMFSLGLPSHSMELNMRRFLHTYTHLRKDPQSRTRDLVSVCTDAKLELGMQTVLRETEGIPVLRPHISTRQISTSSTEFGASTVAVYAFDTMNTVQIFLAACGAILGCGSAWPNYTQLDSYGRLWTRLPTVFAMAFQGAATAAKTARTKWLSRAVDCHITRSWIDAQCWCGTTLTTTTCT